MIKNYLLMRQEDLKLVGNKVFLQRFNEVCLTDTYLRWLEDSEVLRFSNQRFCQHNRDSCLKYINGFVETPNLFLAIYALENGCMIGTMTAYVAEPHNTADMGILIGDRSIWGKGFGYDAWSTLMQFLIYDCGLRKVTGGTLRCNVGMVRIMERSGMHLEAVRKRQEIVDGMPQDILYFAKFRNV